MKLTAKDFKAISWYAEENGLHPQLSTPPIMYFRKKDGDTLKVHLDAIKLEYNAWNEQDKKIRARQRKQKAGVS